ncbi:hypothetical protein [Jeotgalibacillus campisalis]|uniref:Uncharacterized protein n=1 Tax=Jeotgalibacillus campisalis TaxID=220754 RepID=A0A0C2V295_9BACL|nr:hypothetical protein [Jeotgalibacillus campisalis]KIL43172.1 hypothetical protein KR50_35750 [Jeotgalibacillus campisalis]
MSEQEYHFRVRYKDFEYSVTGDEAFVAHHEEVASGYLSKLMEEKTYAPERPALPASVGAEERPVPVGDPRSKAEIKAFLEGLPLYSEWQYTLAMAYFLFHHKQQTSFSAKSVRKQFREARHTVPNNIHLSIHTCVKKGYLKESGLEDLQKNYEITETGMQYITGLTNGEVPDSSLSRGGSSTEVEPNRQEKLLNFTLEELQLDHNPNPQLLERLEDQALSILYIYKKELDFTHLSALDVHTVLTELFSFSYSPKAVQIALSRSRPRVEKIKYDGQMHYQLTQGGVEYMENLMQKQLFSED